MTDQLSLSEQVRRLATMLDDNDIPYLIGGALALAYHVDQPRATQDIDIQVYPPGGLEAFLSVLSQEIVVTDRDRTQLEQNLQARLRWSGTPVDIFLPADRFHEQMRERAVKVRFPGMDRPLRIVSATDLTVLKALFDRPKDWVDIGEMVAAGSVDLGLAIAILGGFDAPDAVARLSVLA